MENFGWVCYHWFSVQIKKNVFSFVRKAFNYNHTKWSNTQTVVRLALNVLIFFFGFDFNSMMYCYAEQMLLFCMPKSCEATKTSPLEVTWIMLAFKISEIPGQKSKDSPKTQNPVKHQTWRFLLKIVNSF